MNELIPFNFNGGHLSVVMIDENPHFIAKDVCDMVGIENSRQAVSALDDDEKLMYTLLTAGQNRTVNLVTESGLYSLVIRSNKPEAKPFKKWITSEVLPSIRKHGAYLTDQAIEKALTDPDTIIRLATDLKEERAKRLAAEKSNETLRVSHSILKQIAGMDELLKMDEVAKIVGIKGFGRNKMFAKLRELRILNSSNVPMQEYVDRGYFMLKEKMIERKGNDFPVKVTLCTQKGLMWICKKFNIDPPSLNTSKAI